MIPAPCTNRLIRGGWCVGSQPAILVGAWIARSVAEWSVRTARIDRQSCMRSSHAPRTRNPEPRVRENRKTESRKTDSGTVCRKTPSRGAGGSIDALRAEACWGPARASGVGALAAQHGCERRRSAARGPTQPSALHLALGGHVRAVHDRGWGHHPTARHRQVPCRRPQEHLRHRRRAGDRSGDLRALRCGGLVRHS